MSHMHARLSPAAAKRLKRQIERRAAADPVPYQYRVRVRRREDAPFGAWEYACDESRPFVPFTFSDRADAERLAAVREAGGWETSITCTATNGD